MSYTALYRKFRPSAFEEVKGQDHIVKTLKNQIRADRVGHAYLFCGTRGTGKTTIARILAKAVNCEHPVDGSPCGECASCRAITAGASMNVIEIDAASNNGVENIREIREEVAYPPTEGKYKVYIIDKVHMLSTGAFNALLKTLEEPPSYVIFILGTTEAHKIPVTILSRCQRYDFRRISQETIYERLKDLAEQEHVDAEEKALRYVARKGDGAMRDALSLLDQCIAFYMGETLTYDKVLDVLGAVDTEVFSELLDHILHDKITDSIALLDRLILDGRDLTQFVSDFTWYLRNLMLIKASDDMEDILDLSTENLVQLKREASVVRNDALMRYIRIFSELSSTIRYAVNKRVVLEMALIKLCRPEAEKDEYSLIERIRKLEKRLEEGIMAVPPQGGYAQMAPQMQPGGFGGAASYPAQEQGGASFENAAPGSLQKAAPEDLKKIRSMWRSIIAETVGGFKMTLASAEVKYNAEDENDNRLFVVFTDYLAERYTRNASQLEARKAELESIIADKTGKQVEVKLMLAADEAAQKGNLAVIDLDERIREFIHTDIEITDEN